MCDRRALDNVFRRRLGPPTRLLGALDLREGQVVADLGAGVGYYAPEVLRRVGPSGRLYLVEIDEENLEIARQRLRGDARATFLVASAASVEGIPSSTVDRALLSLVLCCLGDKRGALSEVWRILKPGGSAIVTFPFRLWVPRFGRKPLGLTRAGFDLLAAQRPWTVERLPGTAVRRYRLRKPR